MTEIVQNTLPHSVQIDIISTYYAVHSNAQVIIFSNQLLLRYARTWTAGMEKYLDKNEGRHEFQIDLGLLLMNYALALD